ncbi:acylphosphatase [Scopulibacillus cellulosilyticus]|uniref:Acylphosphatase n=1 Tax=Scopulibacillus cellulosilyticus TaxID=2665665 RepID=A0ABW2PV78_9BACL
MQRIRAIIRGSVQGVGFRFFTQQTAEKYNIKGWVKNNADGTVEIEAEGESGSLDNFFKVIKEGNRFSHVEDLALYKKESLKHFNRFKITY